MKLLGNPASDNANGGVVVTAAGPTSTLVANPASKAGKPTFTVSRSKQRKEVMP